MTESKKFRQVTLNAFLTFLAVLTPVAITPCRANGQASGPVARGFELAADQGRVAPEQEQTITVFLKLHDQAGFDQAVAELYDPSSPTYHQWFTDADFAKYAPTAAELQTVKQELEKQGLSTISIDPQNFSIRVKGTVRAIENAFQTELHTFQYKNTRFQTPRWEGKLSGTAGDRVAATAGLERHSMHPSISVSKNPQTGQPLFSKKITATQTAAELFSRDYLTDVAITAPMNITLRHLGPQAPGDSIGHYFGPIYAPNYLSVVSYPPARLQSHYGLSSLIQQGYDGSGQTIVVLEAYGYAGAEADANAAASAFGLPLLTAKNFQVVYPEGQPLNPSAADLAGWTTEIALDIQAAHAIAPGANIVEVASSGQDTEDQVTSLEYIRRHRLGNVVSCSFENDPEIISGADEENAFNNVLERLAAEGISVQFASGDTGDLGLGTPLGSVSVPSNSPYATAVGGTSVLNDPLSNGDIVTGWGTYVSVLQFVSVFNPPVPQPTPTTDGFFFGAGGGESQFFAKPAWQQALPGSGRQVPDVSADADPLTGFSIVTTLDGSQTALAGVGGTSLATPIFSAIWAIANQYNGKSLGLAAPVVARLQKGQITDVVNTSDLSPDSLSGTLVEDTVSTFFSTDAIFNGSEPPIAQTNYLAAMSPLEQGVNNATAYAVTFGADTSLTVEEGWDNVTGFGEPNGLPFIQGVTGKTKGARIVK
jgi:subtilase family serine protease